MKNTITLIHVTDLHARSKDIDELDIRVKALLGDLEDQEISADHLVFTGDLAFSGSEAEYELARTRFLDPIMRHQRLTPNEISIIPGNHDVFRKSIDQFAESGLRAGLRDSLTAEAALANPEHSTSRLQHFLNFSSAFYRSEQPLYSARTLSTRDALIGIARMNTAWRSSTSGDKGFLFLTEKQVVECSKAIEGCDLAIGLMHHPFDWLAESELYVTVPDARNQFNILMTGHIHIPISESVTTTESTCIHLTSRAFWNERKESESIRPGYNIYQISLADKTLTAKYRHFIRSGRRFDADTVHAKNGEQEYRLPVRSIRRFSQSLVVQRIGEASTELQREMNTLLAKYQERDNLLYVAPELKAYRMSEGSRVSSKVQEDPANLLRRLTFIQGQSESGKSVFCNSLAASINQASYASGVKKLAVVVDRHYSSDPKLSSRIKDQIKGRVDAETALVIIIDDLNEQDTAELSALQVMVDENPTWQFVVTIRSQIIFDGLFAGSDHSQTRFLKLELWGPSRIRKVVDHILARDLAQPVAAFDFVIRSLKASDLPATPVVVFLYVSVFAAYKGNISSLSFLQLIERYIHSKLSSFENSGSEALFNKEALLRRLAVHLCQNGKESKLKSDFIKEVHDYFESSDLPANASAYVQDLIDIGILVDEDDRIFFRYYAFFDYYLAEALVEGECRKEDLTKDLESFIFFSDSIAFYGGRKRSDEEIARQAIAFIDDRFKDATAYTIADLDTTLTSLFLPACDPASVELEVERAASKERNYEELDKEFEEDKAKYEKSRSGPIKRPLSGDLPDLILTINGLAAFYKLYRNLENLPGSVKVELLDRIMDYQIHCTIQLIKFFQGILADARHKSLFAYLATLGTQDFMTSYIGNQSLGRTIIKTIGGSDNEFKRLLLTALYGDLKLQGYEKMIEDIVKTTESLAAIELCYSKIRTWMVEFEGRTIPNSLIEAFRTIFEKRSSIARKLKISGSAIGEEKFAEALKAVRQDHLYQRAETVTQKF